MAVGSERGSANPAKSRGRASTNGSGASSASGGTRAGTRAASSQSRSRPSSRSSSQRAQSRSGSSGSRGTSGGSRGAFANVGIPIVTGAAGIAGGVLLGRTALQRNKKFLGIPLPTKIDFSDVTQQIGEAGRQFGKLAQEVKAAREKAEQVGRAIS
jgi:hypothetical protein